MAGRMHCMSGWRPVCEQTLVTSQGSAYARFRRALNSGNLTLIRNAAAELPRVGPW
jgi:hypothetical protein